MTKHVPSTLATGRIDALHYERAKAFAKSSFAADPPVNFLLGVSQPHRLRAVQHTRPYIHVNTTHLVRWRQWRHLLCARECGCRSKCWPWRRKTPMGSIATRPWPRSKKRTSPYPCNWTRPLSRSGLVSNSDTRKTTCLPPKEREWSHES